MPADDLRLQPAPMNMPLEIAQLVKTLPLERGVELIEEYARMVGTGMKIDAATEVYNRIDALLAPPKKPVSGDGVWSVDDQADNRGGVDA